MLELPTNPVTISRYEGFEGCGGVFAVGGPAAADGDILPATPPPDACLEYPDSGPPPVGEGPGSIGGAIPSPPQPPAPTALPTGTPIPRPPLPRPPTLPTRSSTASEDGPGVTCVTCGMPFSFQDCLREVRPPDPSPPLPRPRAGVRAYVLAPGWRAPAPAAVAFAACPPVVAAEGVAVGREAV